MKKIVASKRQKLNGVPVRHWNVVYVKNWFTGNIEYRIEARTIPSEGSNIMSRMNENEFLAWQIKEGDKWSWK